MVPITTSGALGGGATDGMTAVAGSHGLLPSLPPRPSTAEHAAAVVRAQIASGALKPGTRLREEEVAESFSISRNTVREAFRLLAHERLVEHVAYRGVHIRRLGPDDIKAMYHTRRLVEPLGIPTVIADPELRQVVRDIVDTALAAAEKRDWQQVGTCDIAFHRTLVAGCRSVHLEEMFEKLLAELRLAFLQLSDERQLHQPYLARNRRLLELIDAGRADEVEVELSSYLNAAEHDVLRELEG